MNTPQAPEHAPRRSPDEIRSAIVDATVRIIGRHGVGAVTHRAVAEDAGVSLSSTTYHYATKADIVDAALRQVAAAEIARVEALTAEAHHVTDADSLVDLLVAWFEDQLAGDRDLVRAGYELQLESARTPALREAHRDWGRAVQELARDALARAGSPEPRADAYILAAFIDGLRLDEITTPRPDVASRARPLFTRLLGALIGAADGR